MSSVNEKEGVDSVAGREGTGPLGSNSGGAEGHACGWLKQKGPFVWEARCTEGPRGWNRTSIGSACSEGPKRLGHRGPLTTCHPV